MASGRADPFAGTDIDLSDFATKPAARPDVSAEAVREVSERHRFTSRAGKDSPPPREKPEARSPSPPATKLKLPAQSPSLGRAGETSASPPPNDRRHRTHRNVQMNLKMTSEFEMRFKKLADRLTGRRLTEAFEQAVIALEQAYPE